jgi:hypothetical protein
MNPIKRKKKTNFDDYNPSTPPREYMEKILKLYSLINMIVQDIEFVKTNTPLKSLALQGNRYWITLPACVPVEYHEKVNKSVICRTQCTLKWESDKTIMVLL